LLLEDDLNVISDLENGLRKALGGRYSIITVRAVKGAIEALNDTMDSITCFVLDLNMSAHGVAPDYVAECLGTYLTGWVFYRHYVLKSNLHKNSTVIFRSAYVEELLRDYVTSIPEQKMLFEQLKAKDCLFKKTDPDDIVINQVKLFLDGGGK